MANKTSTTFFFLIANILISAVSKKTTMEELSRSFTFAGVENTSSIFDSNGELISTHNARSVVDCAHKCLTKKECQVIGFNARSGVCWLMKSANRNVVLKSRNISILKKVDFEKAPEEKVEVFSSCKDVVEKGRSKGNGVYNIKTNQTSSTKTYCYMDRLPECGGGGWTLTMKINGSKNTFGYSAKYWTNKQHLKTENGLVLKEKESKLPTYWSTPLTKICLGMKRLDRKTSGIKWIKLELKQPAKSLLHVITTGYPVQPYTLLGVNKWKDTFLLDAKYSVKKSLEGINISLSNGGNNKVKVRLGVLYSFSRFNFLTYIGFGTWGYWYPRFADGISCGYDREKSDGNTFTIPSFCFILVH